MWIDLHATVYLVYAYENTCIDLFVTYKDRWMVSTWFKSIYVFIHPSNLST